MIDTERIKAITERLDKTTAGPWVYNPSYMLISIKNANKSAALISFSNHETVRTISTHDDAKFIANARQDVPYLLEVLKDVPALVETLKDVPDLLETLQDALQKSSDNEKLLQAALQLACEHQMNLSKDCPAKFFANCKIDYNQCQHERGKCYIKYFEDTAFTSQQK